MPEWRKQGLIFHLYGKPERSTHAQVPTVLVKEDVVRIYYACRSRGKAFPAYFDVDRKDLTKVVNVHEESLLPLGDPGMFDSDGIMPSCVIEKNGCQWLYYIGWNARAEGARYHNEIGIAASADGGHRFERLYRGPVVGRSPAEPGLAVMPFVMNHNGIYKMWYQSGVSWKLVDGIYEPVYVIKYAQSHDGITWERDSAQCVESNYPMEAFSRPSVILSGGVWRMWFCYRDCSDYRGGKGSYRIGYAQSSDGIHFRRMDCCAGITVGESGQWDSEMICYPFVTEIDGRLVMFYNGNAFGQSGIGLAVYD